MTDWQQIDLPGLEPWTIHVLLGPMPDGTMAPIGLRIDPRDDYDGSLRDQRVKQQMLRSFPIGPITSAAIADLPEADYGAQLAARADALMLQADVLRGRMRDDATEVEARITREIGPRKARLVIASGHYRVALETGAASPRRYVAEQMGVSPTTVDRLLRDARKEGFLERYAGGQGKHGES